MVLAVLRAGGSASRAQLATGTGLTRATVATLLEPLLDVGVLTEDAAAPRGVGRPSRAVRFRPDGPVALGVAVDVDTLTI
ncbi:MAG: ROK family transcriptional regulator, partial [Pseudonocardiales bacterium]|nr:ROK family transcriptional regulator [Pseudonocardiales bacterium]